MWISDFIIIKRQLCWKQFSSFFIFYETQWDFLLEKYLSFSFNLIYENQEDTKLHITEVLKETDTTLHKQWHSKRTNIEYNSNIFTKTVFMLAVDRKAKRNITTVGITFILMV